MDVDRRALLIAGAGTATVGALTPFPATAAGKKRTKTFKGRFTEPPAEDWHYLGFRVPEGVRRISVRYDYEPTETGFGLTFNVVDIGIFDPDGFRGWSGGARRSFSLSRTGATPGYLPGPIKPGVWRIALGPYLITPPGTPYTVRVTLHFGRPGRRFKEDPAPTSVPGRGAGWYRADLHTHTFHSDGARTRGRLVGSARAAGLDVLGSSEHNTSSATLSWGRHAPDDLLVVSGEEVTTRAGHWLAMGIPAGTWIDWRHRPEDAQLAVFTDRVRELGGVAIACHPFNPVPSIRWGFGTDFEHMDAFEIWNGPWTGDDQTAVENWDRMLRRGRFVPAVGASDSHHDGQAVGLAQSVLRLDACSAEEVVAAVQGGHLYVAESSAVSLGFDATAGPATASCGDTLEASPDDLVTVTLTASGVPGCVGQLIGPAGVLAGALAGADGTLVVTVAAPATTIPYVRAEVRRPNGEVNSPTTDLAGSRMVALTNPVFVTSSA